MRLPLAPLLALLAVQARPAAAAGLALAPVFGDHAVLQEDRLAPVWGWAGPGERVRVTFQGQTAEARAGRDGRWIALLGPLAADRKGSDLVARAGGETAESRDVLVGEVWLCSGQSNMEFTVDDPRSRLYHLANAAAEVAAARHPLIRQYTVARRSSARPVADTAGSWAVCSPATVGRFTAVGYFFARDLQARLGVPVGIIDGSWGGTPVEAWMSPESLASDPAFAVVAGRWRAEPPPAVYLHRDSWRPSGLFNGMINPLLPCALRGVVWYQGESNANRAGEYHRLFAAMIAGWRAEFGEGDLPFAWVQLPGYRDPHDPTGERWAWLREAQAQTLSLPDTGMAVTIDLGDPANIHPGNKQEVGRRLALIAKAEVYGIAEDYRGPAFVSAERDGRALRLRFAHAEEGLIAVGGPLRSFAVAGPDRRFHPAAARIEGDAVVVSSPAVPDPVAVRYAWSDWPDANLSSGNGLPAAPFRSDDW
jgi:sialate O-acetylesterase